MGFAFFGTPDFAATVIEKLSAAGMPPAFIITNPDRPVGRKKIITPPPAKITAERHGIPVLQPENVSEIKTELQNLKADFFLVAAYAKILPKEIFSIPRLGTIGIHPSLLPRHRGTTPIQSAILAGDEMTGVTLYRLDEKVDHGPIIAGKELKIEQGDDYSKLAHKLAVLAAMLSIETLPKFVQGGMELQVQNEDYATYTKKFGDEDGYVDLEKDELISIERKARALNPEPGVWTFQKNKRMKILEAELADGKLKLKKIQFEGKTPQNI